MKTNQEYIDYALDYFYTVSDDKIRDILVEFCGLKDPNDFYVEEYPAADHHLQGFNLYRRLNYHILSIGALKYITEWDSKSHETYYFYKVHDSKQPLDAQLLYSIIRKHKIKDFLE